jgi:hypothetical protein
MVPVVASASEPRNVFWVPVVMVFPALKPIAVLSAPVAELRDPVPNALH